MLMDDTKVKVCLHRDIQRPVVVHLTIIYIVIRECEKSCWHVTFYPIATSSLYCLIVQSIENKVVIVTAHDYPWPIRIEDDCLVVASPLGRPAFQKR